MDIIRDLRLGEFDVLIGINLLREGLDIPEVALVAILDADKEGFLRSTRSLIQTFGRAARNVNGTVILYADRMTGSMQRAIDETNRRRRIQEEYNRAHHITPKSIQKDITAIFDTAYQEEAGEISADQVAETISAYGAKDDLDHILENLENDMREAAAELDFERAAVLRDRIKVLKQKMLFEGG
jgi:excinuclease ABC subunit B